jgi:hypothetical protein
MKMAGLVLDHVPDILEVVALAVARLAVLLEQVQRLALVGQLLGAVVAGDDRIRRGDAAVAATGGQASAQGPLQALLPLLAVSLSKV